MFVLHENDPKSQREIKAPNGSLVSPLERFTFPSDFQHISAWSPGAFSQATRSQFSPGKDGRMIRLAQQLAYAKYVV